MSKTTKSRREENQIAANLRLFSKCESMLEQRRQAYWAGRVASVAYHNHAKDALALLELLTDSIKANVAAMEGETINWAHSGDMASVAGQLMAIAESLSGAGEYAK